MKAPYIENWRRYEGMKSSIHTLHSQNCWGSFRRKKPLASSKKRSVIALQVNFEEILQRKLTGIEGGGGKLNPWLFLVVKDSILGRVPPEKNHPKPSRFAALRFCGQKHQNKKTNGLPKMDVFHLGEFCDIMVTQSSWTP